MVVYKTGILAVTGSKHGNSFIEVLPGFSGWFYLVSSFRVQFCLVILVVVRVSMSCVSAITTLSSA